MITLPPPPPAIVFTVDIDADRMIDALIEIEGTPWGKTGGALGWTPAAWREDTNLPFRLASNRQSARSVAKIRIARFIATCARIGLYPGPANVGDMWRRGFARAIDRMRRNVGFRTDEYGIRSANLYNDQDFQP